jgi:hypothetical protein
VQGVLYKIFFVQGILGNGKARWPQETLKPVGSSVRNAEAEIRGCQIQRAGDGAAAAGGTVSISFPA